MPRKKRTVKTVKITLTAAMRARAQRGADRKGLELAAYVTLALADRLELDGVK